MDDKCYIIVLMTNEEKEKFSEICMNREYYFGGKKFSEKHKELFIQRGDKQITIFIIENGRLRYGNYLSRKEANETISTYQPDYNGEKVVLTLEEFQML